MQLQNSQIHIVHSDSSSVGLLRTDIPDEVFQEQPNSLNISCPPNKQEEDSSSPNEESPPHVVKSEIKPEEKSKSPELRIPNNCFIGEDGLPACKDGPERWGDGYTFYMTARGRMYHTRYCKVGLRSPFHAINAYTAKNGFRYYDGPHYYKPCSYCNPELPDLTWYEEELSNRN